MDSNGKSRSTIWHWHGYKANTIQCFFHAILNGTWDVSNPGGIKTPDRQAGLRLKTDKGPQKDSYVPGCKVIKAKFQYGIWGCYLKTYAWMLIQHERWITMAETGRLRFSTNPGDTKEGIKAAPAPAPVPDPAPAPPVPEASNKSATERADAAEREVKRLKEELATLRSQKSAK